MVKMTKRPKSKDQTKSFLGYVSRRKDGIELKSLGNRTVAICWRQGMPVIVNRENRYSPAGRIRSI